MNSKEFSFDVVDLTHTLSSDIPDWDGECGFKMELSLDYKDCEEPYLFRKYNMQTPVGVGTHMDSPAHCIPGGETIESLNLKNLVTDCVVIKIEGVGEDFVITPSMVEEFEKQNGKIQPGTFVIFYTGWSKYWNEKNKYQNEHKFPSVHEDTAKILLERNIAGLGIDTLSADTGINGFPVHRAILGAGKYLVENIANADMIPATGSKTLVLPMKIKDATEAPIRLVALIPKK
jgi:kynurenine formamidase